MALGQNTNNNKDKDIVNIWSRISFINQEDTYDPSRLSYSFWGGNMKLTIAPKKDGDAMGYDNDTALSIFISPRMAKNLAEEIQLFIKDPMKYNNVGIATKKGIILVSNGMVETGKFTPMVKISTLNDKLIPEVTFAHAFQSTFSIRNYDAKTGDFEKIDKDLLSLGMLYDALTEFTNASSAAYAYVNLDKFINGGYANKLGKDSSSSYGSDKNVYSQFDNKQPSGNSTTYTSGDLENLL
jgi:hypothetical protein